MKANVEKY